MKGLVITEFLNFIEQTMSYEMVDKILLRTPLASNGIYTSIGTYDDQEFLLLLDSLSKEANIPTNIILTQYGEFLFGFTIKRYPQYFQYKTSTFHFLNSLEYYIYIEVKNFEPHMEMPRFQCKTISSSQFEITYQSIRPLADLVEGFIQGCIHYHKENMEIVREDITVAKGNKTKFTLTKINALK